MGLGARPLSANHALGCCDCSSASKIQQQRRRCQVRVRPNLLRSGAMTVEKARRRAVTTASATEESPQSSWELQRFAKTVMFFSGSPVSLGRMFGGAKTNTKIQAPDSPPLAPVYMVTGATGGVGKRIAQKLVEEGKRVRLLVRDLPKAEEMFADTPGIEIVAADIVQRRTLSPEMFDGIGTLFSCTAVKVAPKEGDTPSREKYYQGIKFFDPEIVGDTPEKVEFQGIQNLLNCAGPLLKISKSVSISNIIFGKDVAWGELDDVVMGGISKSESLIRMGNSDRSNGKEQAQGQGNGDSVAIKFQGQTSLANNGGFASLRCKNLSSPLDLSDFDGIKLRVCGDGQKYKLILRSEEGWDSVGHFLSFETNADGSVQDVLLPFGDFLAVYRGKMLDDTKLDASKVVSFQIMISKFDKGKEPNDKFNEGPFKLDILDASVYKEHQKQPDGKSMQRIVHVSSAGVTRPFRPDEFDFDKEPPAVKLNDELGGILTYKLKGEELIRKSNIPYTIIRPCALTEEPGGMELMVDQGDTIKGKVSREDIAQLCIAASTTESARNATFEIKSTVPFSQVWEGDPSSPPPTMEDMSALLSPVKPDSELTPVVSNIDKLGN